MKILNLPKTNKTKTSVWGDECAYHLGLVGLLRPAYQMFEVQNHFANQYLPTLKLRSLTSTYQNVIVQLLFHFFNHFHLEI